MRIKKKSLGKSITVGCIAFMTVLCVALTVMNYYTQRNAIYRDYQVYLTDILEYANSHIDHDDLLQCIRNGETSETYDETLLFFDGIMNDFDIHYLYAVRPLNLNPTGNVMSVFSAENDYNRYADPEGNLYFGWISDDEYDVATVKKFFHILTTDGITFFTEATEWGTDYTGAMAIRDSKGYPFAVLAADVEISELTSTLRHKVILNAAILFFVGIAASAAFLFWARENIILPIRLLEKGVVDYASHSHGQRDVSVLQFEAPDIRANNEVRSLSTAITRMTEDMQDYVSVILSAEEETQTMKAKADEMTELANRDALTGLRSTTAYKFEMARLQKELSADPSIQFGIAMIDLNFLKKMNDNYGHVHGDAAIRQLSAVICDVFLHSPVFRIGGDEFVLLLRGRDFQNIDTLRAKFIKTMNEIAEDDTLAPWERTTAAIGVAIYNPETDQSVEDVFNRADEAMYAMKREMKEQGRA